jgi:valyl-tRNA synthetase
MIQAERVRLNREIERLSKFLHAQQAKLLSSAFVEKAPPAVVQKERDKLAQTQVEIAQLKERLDRIAGME